MPLTESAYLVWEDGDRRGRFPTVQTRDLTSPSFPSGGILAFSHAAATCDVSLYELHCRPESLCPRLLEQSHECLSFNPPQCSSRLDGGNECEGEIGDA